MSVEKSANDCLKAVRDIGSTTWVDVCRDQVLSTIPWGAADWLLLVTLCTITLAVTVMLGVMLFLSTEDYRKRRAKSKRREPY